jgi:FAD/FMN-containing dehydrogenase
MQTVKQSESNGYSEDSKDLAQYHVKNPVQRYGSTPGAVFKPRSLPELQQIIREAQERKLGLVPVSSGGPHSKTGINCREGHAVVDLSGWKAIPFLNRRNRVVQIEPGVTYGQLLTALKAQGMAVPMPLAPRRDKSVVAALCERHSVTWSNKQWETSDPIACMEFVFGTADSFVTGAAGGPGTLEQQRKVGQAQKAPLGPGSIDFHRLVQGSQGSFGVATWLTVRAELAPSIEKPYLVGAAKLEDLYAFVYGVQRPKLGEESFILNRTAAAMLMTSRGPEKFADVYASLPEYVCLQNIAGFDRLPRERLDYQEKDIRKFADASSLKLSLQLGQVTAQSMLEAARDASQEIDWRHALHGNCLSVLFQCTLDQSHKYIEIVRTLAARHGIAAEMMGVYIQPIVQNRFCEVEILFPYADTAKLERLKTLEVETFDALNTAHAFFSRPYGHAELAVFKNNPVNTEFLRKMKQIFDPGHILNPGKFGF